MIIEEKLKKVMFDFIAELLKKFDALSYEYWRDFLESDEGKEEYAEYLEDGGDKSKHDYMLTLINSSDDDFDDVIKEDFIKHFQCGELTYTEIRNEYIKKSHDEDEIENTVKNINTVATELLPNAVLLSEEEFWAKNHEDNMMMCSKEFFGFISDDLKQIVSGYEFTYLIVTKELECFIKN